MNYLYMFDVPVKRTSVTYYSGEMKLSASLFENLTKIDKD